MQLKKINVRPMREQDNDVFQRLRRLYWDADLEIPKGFGSPGVETAVAEDGAKKPIASLTGTLAIVLDPLIKDPEADPLQLVTAIYLLERTLAYQGQRMGAVDAYIAIPNQLVGYHEIVKKAGYLPTVQNCTVYRRPLLADTHPLLGDEREAAHAQAAAAAELAPQADTVTEHSTESEETAKAV